MNAEALELLVQHTVRAAMKGELGARQLANVAYGVARSGIGKSLAFATVGHPDAELFTVLARAAEQRIRDFSPQNLANTAWAFATLGLSDAQLFTVLVRAAEHRIRDFNAQNLTNTAWAFATLGTPVPALFDLI